jgi:hypothetical protein
MPDRRRMSIRSFLLLAAVAFLVATTGSDVFARVTIGGETLTKAFSEHFYWAAVQFIGTLMLLAPFGFLAVIASWVQERTNTWKALAVFGVPTLYLIYSYFDGYQASQAAMLDKRWTAATLSIGFLPFAAAPVVLFAWLVALILVRLRRNKDAGA